MRMFTALREWSQKRTLRAMLKDPRSTRGFRSTGQLERGIGATTSAEHRREKGRGRGRVDAQSALSVAAPATNRPGAYDRAFRSGTVQWPGRNYAGKNCFSL